MRAEKGRKLKKVFVLVKYLLSADSRVSMGGRAGWRIGRGKKKKQKQKLLLLAKNTSRTESNFVVLINSPPKRHREQRQKEAVDSTLHATTTQLKTVLACWAAGTGAGAFRLTGSKKSNEVLLIWKQVQGNVLHLTLLQKTTCLLVHTLRIVYGTYSGTISKVWRERKKMEQSVSKHFDHHLYILVA